jgi:gliding motility-associated lipoprotein GldH
MRKVKYLLMAVLLPIMVSCGPDVVYEEYVTIPEGGWSKDSMASFMVDIKDVDVYYDIYINVRNRSDYPNSNIWLFLEVTAPEGTKVRDTLNIFLANPHGEWLGSGWGDLYHVKYLYHNQPVKFAKAGEYIFDIIQGMRYDELEGIYNIGLTIEKSRNQTPAE